MRPVVELVTTGVANVVRKHHVDRAIGTKALYLLNCGDLKDAKDEKKQNNAEVMLFES